MMMMMVMMMSHTDAFVATAVPPHIYSRSV